MVSSKNQLALKRAVFVIILIDIDTELIAHAQSVHPLGEHKFTCWRKFVNTNLTQILT